MYNLLRLLGRKFLEVEVSERAMDACETIITEMGADLHDDLIQRLSVLRLHLDRLELCHSDPDLAKAAIEQMNVDFQSVTTTVRRIAKRLYSPDFEGDSFEQSLNRVCHLMDLPGTMRIQVQSIGEAKVLPMTAERYLLRMVQELVHNSFKHSAAWHVAVEINWSNNWLIISVEDDGSGIVRLDEFVTRLKQKNNTLKMRAVAIGAQLEYRQGTKGLQAQIKYPIPDQRIPLRKA